MQLKTLIATSAICVSMFIALIKYAPYAHSSSLPLGNDTDTEIKHNVDLLNELAERRRINTFFTNEQSLFYGLQKGYVNVSKGNATFVRTDMVLTNRIPIVIARVYDSSANNPSDFSKGWQLTLAQSINEQSDGSLLLKDDNAIIYQFSQTNQGYEITPRQKSDISSIEKNAAGIRVNYINGWNKQFKLIGEKYQLKKIADNNNNQVTLSYQNNLLTKISGDNGTHATIKRDELQRITAITDNQQRTVSYRYNKKQQLSRVKDIGNNNWRYKYSDQGLLHKAIDPLEQVAAKFSYNSKQQVKLSKIRSLKYRYRYQVSKDQLFTSQTQVTDNNGNQSIYEHNNQGITTKVTNNLGFVSKIILNKNNQVNEIWHNDIQLAQISYDNFGSPIKTEYLTADNQQQYQFQFDHQGRVTNIENEQGQFQRYQYDTNGNLTSHQSPNHMHQYRYNQKGDVIFESVTSNDNQTQTFTYQYNDYGLMTQLDKQFEQQAYSAKFDYNPLGKLEQITFPDGSTHHYQYTALGFRSSTQRSDGSAISYIYDNLGNLTSQINTDTNQQTSKQTLTINRDNQVTQVDMNTSDQPTYSPVKIQYDDHNNPTSLIQGEQQINYQYDSFGRLTNIDNLLRGQSQYQYQPNETDIRVQLDKRTAKTFSVNNKVSSHNQNLPTLLYARMSGSPWQVVDFNPALDKFLLPNPDAINAPNAGFQSAKQRIRLYNAISTNKQAQYAFDKASNSFFLPPEYQAINCYYGCETSTFKINKPAVTIVGYPVNIDVVEQTQECLMAYYLNVEGTNTASTTGKFTHVFQTPGLHPVKVRGLCQMCPWADTEVVSYIDVKPAPKCSVDFEITSTDNFKISTTPTMPAISARITHKSPANATIQWAAQIEHFAPKTPACSGSTNADSPDVTGSGDTFTPSWSNEIFGGDLLITATCSAPGHDANTKTIEDYEIEGTEPNNTIYSNQLTGGLTTPLDPNDLRRIACKESNLKHFNNNGSPLYGGGGDVGVMQICFNRQTNHIWNYQDNIAYARQILNEKIASARNSLNAQMEKPGATQWTQDKLRSETIHRYNAGNKSESQRYWDWNTQKQEWQVVDLGGIGGYFTDVNNKPANCTN